MCVVGCVTASLHPILTPCPSPPIPTPHTTPHHTILSPTAQARQQLSRERVVAAAELKVLHQQLQWCYHANGVNHYEACRELVEKVAAKVKAPYYGMLNAPSREY